MGKLLATGDLVYPTPAGLKIVEEAGGMSKLSPEQRERVKLKHVKAGGYCDDLPSISRDSLIASGKVTESGKTSEQKVVKGRKK